MPKTPQWKRKGKKPSAQTIAHDGRFKDDQERRDKLFQVCFTEKEYADLKALSETGIVDFEGDDGKVTMSSVLRAALRDVRLRHKEAIAARKPPVQAEAVS